jgi:hypothetical protein
VSRQSLIPADTAPAPADPIQQLDNLFTSTAVTSIAGKRPLNSRDKLFLATGHLHGYAAANAMGEARSRGQFRFFTSLAAWMGNRLGSAAGDKGADEKPKTLWNKISWSGVAAILAIPALAVAIYMAQETAVWRGAAEGLKEQTSDLRDQVKDLKSQTKELKEDKDSLVTQLVESLKGTSTDSKAVLDRIQEIVAKSRKFESRSETSKGASTTTLPAVANNSTAETGKPK